MFDTINIKERMWKCFGKSADEIMAIAQVRVVALGNKSGYDKNKITWRETDISVGNKTIKTYRLAQRIQDKEGIVKTDTSNGFEITKTIDDVPYALLHERGGTLPIVSRAQRAVMFMTMRALGIYRKGVTGSGQRVYPARAYVHKGLESIDIKQIAKPIIRQIQQEFTNDKVIIIGDQ